jgi:hypothetical protein
MTAKNLGFVIATLLAFFLFYTYVHVLPAVARESLQPGVTAYATLGALSAILMVGMTLPGYRYLALVFNVAAGVFSFFALFRPEVTTLHVVILLFVCVSTFEAIWKRWLLWVERSAVAYLLLLTLGWHSSL